MNAHTYRVPGISCSHCERAIAAEVSRLPGVRAVEVDVDAKLVTVRGVGLQDAAVRAAIGEAGYEAA
jgi:copper chaperone CopZ